MFISPMLLQTAASPFSHPDFIFEPKIDGHRLIYSQINGHTRLYTRHNNDCTRQYPELQVMAIDDIILDGEVASVDRETGTIDFESIMERFSLRKDDKVRRAAAARPVNYIVFDILRYKGEDLRGLPLYKRKEILASLDFGNPCIAKTPVIEANGDRLYEHMVSQRMEGMVAKRRDSVYVSSRSEAWLKVINWAYVDVVITGYRKDEFGWLTAVADSSGKLRPTGIIELGVTPTAKAAFNRVKGTLKTGEDKNFVYVEPRIKARVKIRNWTKAGLLRSPAFVEFVIAQK